jgi:hypothetical protein
MIMRHRALALLLTIPSMLQAQSGRGIVGVVRDSAGRAIHGAEVRGGDASLVYTNERGFFRIAELPETTSRIVVRRLGFAPARLAVRPGATDSVNVSLGAIATVLPALRIRERRDSLSHLFLPDFWERRARGMGIYVTRDEIEERGPIDFVQLLRQYASVRIQRSRGGDEVRFNRNGQHDCPPQYWVDGIPLDRASASEFTPYNVEAVELYPSPATTPPRFARGPGICGVIVIWTRLPG